MEGRIKIGSVVQLKSGGPKMTVSTIDKAMMEDHLSAWCDWFVQDKAPWKKENGVFPLTSLKLIEP
ncbi:DUF2158 domain-containing protein [Hoeflea sp.]|uniref:DUF2158 domain-containing protein n=1 Tax=Hoeflea sp. TaxID=1940281 RepID=UPI003B521AB1